MPTTTPSPAAAPKVSAAYVHRGPHVEWLPPEESMPLLWPHSLGFSSLGQYYELHGPPLGQAPVLLLVHGYGSSRQMFYPFAQHLLPHFTLLMADNRGHGNSRGMEQVAQSIEDYAHDLAQLLHELKLPRVKLMGYSMGGAIAQALALGYPEKIEQVVLGSTFANKKATFNGALSAPIGRAGVQVVGPTGASVLMNRVFMGGTPVSPITFSWARRQLRGIPKPHLVAAMRALMAYDGEEALTRLHHLTLVLAGTHDRVVVPAHARRMHERLPNAAPLLMVEGAGHGLLQTHSQAVAQEVLRFLQPSA